MSYNKKPSELFNSFRKVCHPKPSGFFPKVQPGLSITPSEMMKLAEQGIPVSAQAANLEAWNDGTTNPSWYVDSSRLRGIDPADLWQIQRSVRKKMRNAHFSDVEKFGDYQLPVSKQN